jgi:hypothetical protein
MPPTVRRRSIRLRQPTTRATTLLAPAGSISGTLVVNAYIDWARMACPAAVGQDARLTPAGGGPPRNWLRTGIRPSGRHDAMFFVNTAYRFFSGRFGLGAASIFFLSSTPAPGTPPPPPSPIFGLLTPV